MPPATVSVPSSRRRSWRRRALFAFVYLLFLYVLGEVVARGYWAFSQKVPFAHAAAVRFCFHSELRDSGVLTTPIRRDDATFDVLLLGGSVLHAEFGNVEALLKERLAARLGRPVRVFNLGHVARTSRDSWLKYKELEERRFDLVVNYDNINDVRLNNCPADVFRADYAHSVWYVWLKQLRRHPELGLTALPFTAEFYAVRLLDRLRLGGYLPQHAPRPDWLAHGAEVKTAGPFRHNVERILATAARRGDPVLLMTFATHLPTDYSAERFKRKQLDYATHKTPTELWGLPANVAQGVAVHNAILRDLAARHPEVLFVDQEKLLPRGKATFNDLCHLTPEGCARLVDNMVAKVGERFGGKQVAGR